MYNERLEKHYSMGTWYGQATSGVVYALAVLLDRVDNDILWCAHACNDACHILTVSIPGSPFLASPSSTQVDEYRETSMNSTTRSSITKLRA